jgi:hypothetical protein
MTPNAEIVAWLREQAANYTRETMPLKGTPVPHEVVVRYNKLADKYTAAANALEAQDALAGQVVQMRDSLKDALSTVDALEKQGDFGVNDGWASDVKGMAHDAGDAALALPLSHAAAQVAEWREKAGLLDWAALRSDFTGVRTERRNYHLSIGCSPPKSYTADDLIEALRAAKEQG